MGKNLRRKLIWLLAVTSAFLGFSSYSYPSNAVKIPSGWKLPKAIKESGCDRKKDDLFTAKGDFDGDGKADTAKFLAKESGKGVGVWVWLSSKKTPILIDDIPDVEDGKHNMGISTIGAGTYDTACGKGYWDCKSGETAKITLKNTGIDIFTCESANQYMYWSEKDKKFKGIWISD